VKFLPSPKIADREEHATSASWSEDHSHGALTHVVSHRLQIPALAGWRRAAGSVRCGGASPHPARGLNLCVSPTAEALLYGVLLLEKNSPHGHH
jgi:hypothetical protein